VQVFSVHKHLNLRCVMTASTLRDDDFLSFRPLCTCPPLRDWQVMGDLLYQFEVLHGRPPGPEELLLWQESFAGATQPATQPATPAAIAGSMLRRASLAATRSPGKESKGSGKRKAKAPVHETCHGRIIMV